MNCRPVVNNTSVVNLSAFLNTECTLHLMDMVICMCDIYHIYYSTYCTDLTAFTHRRLSESHLSCISFDIIMQYEKKEKIEHMLWSALLLLVTGLSLRYTSKNLQQKVSSSEKEASLRIVQDQSQWWVLFCLWM